MRRRETEKERPRERKNDRQKKGEIDRLTRQQRKDTVKKGIGENRKPENTEKEKEKGKS